MSFTLSSTFQPTGDQLQAIAALTKGVQEKAAHQVLLGVTGSGKTFTMANVIANVQKPTLIIAHNKTLAAQLYQEFRDFFPESAVSYFVSYYDYYQPEAYIPSSDTYIEKDSSINDEIDKLRLASTTNLLTRPDVIVVASVSCIYNLGSPIEYAKYVLRLVEGEIISRETVLLQLANLQYERSEVELFRGSYRLRGDTIQVWPAYEERALRIETLEQRIESISWIDPISGSPIHPTPSQADKDLLGKQVNNKKNEYVIYPAKHYMLDPKVQTESIAHIRTDLAKQIANLNEQGRQLEAYRLQQKVNYDLEMIQELGFVNGIENYSRYFDGRQAGDPPFTLLDYFTENARMFNTDGFLTLVDESHISLPQIRGMHNGDQARKKNLIEYGFRLPSALDNRPLKFDEFLTHNDQLIYVSATPSDWEISHAEGKVVEQVVRPTGLLDPQVELRPTQAQIEDLVIEILNRITIGQRTLVTTLTKKMAEALTDYLNDHQKITKLVTQFKQRQAEEFLNTWQGKDIPVEDMEIAKIPDQYLTHAQVGTQLKSLSQNFAFPKVAYLHSDIDTLERSDILDDLRRGVYDVLVGINLLREGLDLPEVTLVAILDADKEGFLRSKTSLVQTMGRAARHSEGHAILYADRLTNSMQKAISETQRRRQVQIAYNIEHDIDPTTISKPIRERMIQKVEESDAQGSAGIHSSKKSRSRVSFQAQQTQQYLDRSQNQKDRIQKLPTSVIILSKQESLDLRTFDPNNLTPLEVKQYEKKLSRRMRLAADTMDYELAAILRDLIEQMGK